MRIGRIARQGPLGPEPRTVVIELDRGLAIDVQSAEYTRLLGEGDEPEAARRKAQATIPGSLSAGLGSQSLLEDIERAVAAGAGPEALVPLEEAHWLAPLDPPRFRDFMSFEQHHIDARKALGKPVPDVTYELPTYYKAGHLTLVGPDAVVAWPGYSSWIDFELELGFVTGRGGVDLRPEEAEGCLFGVTLLNDFSARDRQFHETRGNLGPAKGKDFATALGPWITTVDELDLDRIDLLARVNGEVWATASSGEAMWSVGEILAYLSTAEPLLAGELIGSGTVGGGCGLELDRRLEPGDVVELEGSGLGSLSTKIEAPRALRWEPSPREPGRAIDGGSIRRQEPR